MIARQDHPQSAIDATEAGTLFHAAVAAVDPAAATARALAFADIPPHTGVWILAMGKAAPAMCGAAVRVLLDRGLEPAGGIVIGTAAGQSPHPGIAALQGDHPEPGPASLNAAARLGETVRRIAPRDLVWVLLSGGTSSLIASPVNGLPARDLSAIYAQLLRAGLDTATMNIVRKRYSRWGAGRLAMALAPARVRVLAISDVPGDDLAAIGSGPCAPDPTTATNVRSILRGASLWLRLPPIARELLGTDTHGTTLETPGAGDPAFRDVRSEIIASNATAVRAVLEAAAALGFRAIEGARLEGAAATAGAELVRQLRVAATASGVPVCIVSGGETTVQLRDASPDARGGRCMELALAAARSLHDAGAGDAGLRATILAAGTDGRDGPTDAAGAAIDQDSWRRIAAAGRDPARDLAAHDAYRALDAIGALLRIGSTGTNVMDIAIGLLPSR